MEELLEVGAPCLRFSKPNSTPSGVFTVTATGFLGTNDDEFAFRPLVGIVAEDGVDGDGVIPPMRFAW